MVIAREAARHYITGLDWPVFPVHPIIDGRCGCTDPRCVDAGKHPAAKGWQRSLASPAAVDGLWADRLGPRGIGLACGPRAGVWGLDVDPRHGGDGTLRGLQERHGSLPETAISRTGGGGWHLLFRWSEGIRNRAGIASGLDVRADGGFLVLPPSAHVSGQRYAWLIGPDEQEPAEAPEWLLELARGNCRRSVPGMAGAEEAPLIPVGRRHEALVQFCGLLRSCGLREEALVECGRAFLRYQVEDVASIDWAHADRTARDVARRYPPYPNRGA